MPGWPPRELDTLPCVLRVLGGRLRGTGRSVRLKFDGSPQQGGRRKVQYRSRLTASGVWVHPEPGLASEVRTSHHLVQTRNRGHLADTATWDLRKDSALLHIPVVSLGHREVGSWSRQARTCWSRAGEGSWEPGDQVSRLAPVSSSATWPSLFPLWPLQ